MIVIGSDLHLGNFKEFSRIDPETGLNSRLLNGINVLEQVSDYMTKHKIDMFVFGGDLVERADKISPDILTEMVKIFRKFKERNQEFVWVVGNHDQSHLSGLVNIAKPFSDYVTVCDVPRSIEWEEDGESYQIMACPYRADREDQLRLFNECKVTGDNAIFVGHCFVRELLPEHLRDKMDCYSVEDLPKGFNSYWFGHYHRKTNHSIYHSIGALMARSFDDVNVPAFGFCVTDIKDIEGAQRFIKTKAPLFLDVDEGHEFNDDNFYRVRVSSKEVRDKIASTGAENVRFVFEAEAPVVDPDVRLDVNPTTTIDDVVARYVAHIGGAQDLIPIGVEYARRAQCVSGS